MMLGVAIFIATVINHLVSRLVPSWRTLGDAQTLTASRPPSSPCPLPPTRRLLLPVAQMRDVADALQRDVLTTYTGSPRLVFGVSFLIWVRLSPSSLDLRRP